jgi:hypothetical protein
VGSHQAEISVERQGVDSRVAETKGFEPSRRFPACTLSRGVPSTTRPRLRRRAYQGRPLGNKAKTGRPAKLSVAPRTVARALTHATANRRIKPSGEKWTRPADRKWRSVMRRYHVGIASVVIASITIDQQRGRRPVTNIHRPVSIITAREGRGRK